MWNRVAKIVKTKNAEDCYKKYMDSYQTPEKNKKSNKSVSPSTSPIKIGDHGKHTQIHKREVRKAIEKVQKNHTDDIFESTTIENNFLPEISFSESEFPELEKTPVQEKVSPSTGSPAFIERVNRNKLDGYIANTKKIEALQKRSKQLQDVLNVNIKQEPKRKPKTTKQTRKKTSKTKSDNTSNTIDSIGSLMEQISQNESFASTDSDKVFCYIKV